MPTLQFKGKSSVWNHHLAIPYHTLDAVPELAAAPPAAAPPTGQLPLTAAEVPTPVPDNLLIEGDNLLALKALLPQFGGRVKCIYIDPPYNTGADKEKWVYNDNVNSPLIREWLGKTVGREDLTRHDKWLCMMTPRLKLLRELLASNGVLFISCDDNEQANLRNLADEIFGSDNWVGTIIWKNVTDNNPTNVAIEHEYILCYALDKSNIASEWKSAISDVKEKLIEVGKDLNAKFADEEILKKEYSTWYKANKAYLSPLDRYKYIDKGGVYTGSQSVHNPGKEGYRYDGLHENGKPTKQPLMGYRFPEESMKNLLAEKRILFGETEDKIVELKVYASEYEDKLPSLITLDGRTGNYDLKEIFPEAVKVFDYPKPVDLIKQLLSYVTKDDDLILDSFAGSGTTGQAVMELNHDDDGRRRFVLVQMTEATEALPDKNIARDVTRQRLARAAANYGYAAGLEYWRVGQALDAETLLAGQLPSFESFARYVYYLATGQHLPVGAPAPDAETYLVGLHGTQAIYLVYRPDTLALTQLALNLELARHMQAAHPRRKLLVYAPACFLDEEHLADWNIEFVSIPYNLFQRPGA